MKHSGYNRSHVLLTLGVLFTLGGAARFIPNNLALAESEAPAEEVVTQEASSNAVIEEHGDKPTPSMTVHAAQPVDEVCFSEATAAALSLDTGLLASEKDALKMERLALEARKAELDSLAVELNALQQTLETRWQQMQTTSDADIKHLAQMYGSMKPDQAAQIFNEMDPGFAAGFLRQLSSDQAGLILAGMETNKAYIVSVKLASKNDDIRKATKAE